MTSGDPVMRSKRKGEIHRLLQLKTGGRVDADGKVVLVPATVDVSELKGLLAPAPWRVSLAGMEAAIRKRAEGS